ncbi:spore germination protein [Paenibacillus kobensis]|uniref:spore germination protein n=1 Tax=Paenibacillus kobensis TaxID=59841 RepID=UPI000FD9C147|nr:spore germination protein [Paenibacillus kobensis]
MNSHASLEQNEKMLRERLSESSDFKVSSITVNGRKLCLYYLESMIDTSAVQNHILQPLLSLQWTQIREAVSILDYCETDILDEAITAIVEGKTVVQLDGASTLYVLGTELKKERSVNLPVNERVLRGSNEALIENLQTNLNLMRKMVATPDLVVRTYKLGKISNTNVAVIYLRSVVNNDVLAEFERRIGRVDTDFVEAPGFLQELIQDKKFSLFPRMLVTERPDRVKAYLMSGKIVILADGAPDCLIVPVTFWAFFQSADDYQLGWLIGSSMRLLRIVCFMLAISMPAAYVALVTFDPRIIPFDIALTLQSSMQYIAMTPIIEAVVMLITLEILREATIRLPNPIGQTIGVVGGIVIGTVVVQSNLVSNMMLIVVAFTAVASFLIPSYEMSSAARYLTYPFITLSATFGLIGLELAFLMLFTHLARIHTMGIPYFFSGVNGETVLDTLVRGPIKMLTKRRKLRR